MPCRECDTTGPVYDRGTGGYCLDCGPAYGHRGYDDIDVFDEYDVYDEECDDTSRGVHSWDYKPDPQFRGTGDYYLGFELEITADSYDVTPILRWCDDHSVPDLLYVKEDGSVAGFEIVSHPMTPEYFDSVPWDAFFGMLNTHYPTSDLHESHGHGLHVHVSRSAFPHKSTLARWSYLLQHNQAHTERVARRQSNNWSRFIAYPVSALLPFESDTSGGEWRVDFNQPLPGCDCCYRRVWWTESTGGRRRQTQNKVDPYERYVAVNLRNEETVEVRVFRSTRIAEEFIASIHYVAATVDFVRSMQPWHATRESVAWHTFADYVKSHDVFRTHADVFLGEPPIAGVAVSTIRQWARNNGYDIGTRGRIPADVQRAYFSAHDERVFN